MPATVPRHCEGEHGDEPGDLWAVTWEGQGTEVCCYDSAYSKATLDERYVYDGRRGAGVAVYRREESDYAGLGASCFPSSELEYVLIHIGVFDRSTHIHHNHVCIPLARILSYADPVR
jgi:hypothetical protein